MSALKRNPLVNLAKAAVGLSAGRNCSCGSAASAEIPEVADPSSLPDQPSQAGNCECKEQAAPAPIEQEASA